MRMEELMDREMMLFCNLIWCVSFWPEDSCSLTHGMQLNEERTNLREGGFKELYTYLETKAVWSNSFKLIWSACNFTLNCHDKQDWAVWRQDANSYQVTMILAEFSSVSGLILANNHRISLQKLQNGMIFLKQSKPFCGFSICHVSSRDSIYLISAFITYVQHDEYKSHTSSFTQTLQYV